MSQVCRFLCLAFCFSGTNYFTYQTKILFLLLPSSCGRFLTATSFEYQDLTLSPESQSAGKPGNMGTQTLCRMVQKWSSRNRWLDHLLLFILSILQPQHEIFHFFPLLPLPHISRAVHISRPDGHLVQPLISKKLL